MANIPLIVLGLSVIGVAVAPTPDDITIISPIVQGVLGTGLIIWGLFTKNE